MSVSLAVSALIFLGIAVRQWLPPMVRIWHIMLMGAIVLLVLGEIRPVAAFHAVDWQLIFYLFAVFSIASSLYDTGLSQEIADMLLKRANAGVVLLWFIVASAICAAVLTNDAAAVIGVPIAIILSRAFKWKLAVVLVTLCAAVTVGSMVSPVGNPQNILVVNAANFQNMLATFIVWALVPGVICLVAVFFRFHRLVKKNGSDESALVSEDVETQAEAVEVSRRQWPAMVSVVLLVGIITGDSLGRTYFHLGPLPFGWVGLLSCLPIYVAGDERLRVFKEVDWATLIFFVAMFIVTGSLYQSSSLQYLLGSLQGELADLTITAVVSFWASQLFSNVPVVELYLKLLDGGSTGTFMMLSSISTVAGNLFIISAASNVIVVQQAEKFGAPPFTFWQFCWWMLPITVFCVVVSYGWIVGLTVLGVG
ncbi:MULTISPECIES: SLC13 family permease [unclassified Pseudovibrio]|uniref:SLC13 family permease n=1 Tax=unclassified Pseudovibrio TaxID=2627060 RepID=UPI0007AEBC2D|nr:MULTISPECIES: SLC13 family permease [unclassified Pseudovibrio]KZK94608.1 Inner membrane protein YbiR [Pseudovibrio sp. W74]KZL04505.1 Inner membrane protein YbiR [Pseudovibrio sp. Ad14]